MAKEINVTIYISEVVYEARNKAHLMVRSFTDASMETTANMQPSDLDAEDNQIRRSVGDAFGVLLKKLSPYLSDNVREKEAMARRMVDGIEFHRCRYSYDDVVVIGNNKLMTHGDNSFIISLTMPDGYNHAFTGAAISAMNGFLVNSALAEWFALTFPQVAGQYADTAGQYAEEVKNALSARVTRVRRRLGVF